MGRFVEKYSPIADMIAKTFGEDCEVVLHDLSFPQNSVVYTVNSHVTGRKVGQSFDHLIKDVLLSRDFKNDSASNYSFYTEDGRLIKSSTALIRDDNNRLIGALCVNIDMSNTVNMIHELQLSLPKKTSLKENADENIDTDETAHISEIVEELIDKIIGDRDVDDIKRSERIEMIRFMEQKGLFLVKGVVDEVAERFKVSRVTIYSYLDEIKGEQQ